MRNFPKKVVWILAVDRGEGGTRKSLQTSGNKAQVTLHSSASSEHANHNSMQSPGFFFNERCAHAWFKSSCEELCLHVHVGLYVQGMPIQCDEY